MPFGAVGAYDSVNMLADSRELRQVPILGPWLEQQIKDIPKVRNGARREGGGGGNGGDGNGGDGNGAMGDEVFVPPLTAPGVPSRFYFLFGAPVETQGEDMEVCLCGWWWGGGGVCGVCGVGMPCVHTVHRQRVVVLECIGRCTTGNHPSLMYCNRMQHVCKRSMTRCKGGCGGALHTCWSDVSKTRTRI